MVINPVVYGDRQQVVRPQFFSDFKLEWEEAPEMVPDLYPVQVNSCKMGNRLTAKNDTLVFKKILRERKGRLTSSCFLGYFWY